MEEKLKAVSYPKGTVLYHEGDPNNGKMYVVNEGRIEASVKIHGQDQTLYQCGQGDIVGEVSFLTGEARTATCVVISHEVRLFELTNDTFATMIREDPNVALKVIYSLVDKLRSVERRLESS